MAKLHQILAIESGVRQQTQKDLTKVHHNLQHEVMISGQSRLYEPLKEDGEKLYEAPQILQVRVPEEIDKVREIFTKMFDVVATRDFANCGAVADVKIGETVILEKAPAPYLLWLEKRLQDLHTFVSKLPTLPSDMEWEWSEDQNCFRNAAEIKTARTQKEYYPVQLSPATDRHPAQVSEHSRDAVVGYWKTMKYSGAIKAQDVKEMKDRVEELQKAVKFAREEANSVEVKDIEAGNPILKYIFG